MFLALTKNILITLFILNIIGCTAIQPPHAKDFSLSRFKAEEKLYQSTANYPALIAIYKQKLQYLQQSSQKYNPSLNYKLSYTYFQNGDSKSTLSSLKKLLVNPTYQEKAMALQVKALVQNKQFQQAINISDELIKKYPNNPNYYNNRGIAYAQLGKFNLAKLDFQTSRKYYLKNSALRI